MKGDAIPWGEEADDSTLFLEAGGGKKKKQGRSFGMGSNYCKYSKSSLGEEVDNPKKRLKLLKSVLSLVHELAKENKQLKVTRVKILHVALLLVLIMLIGVLLLMMIVMNMMMTKLILMIVMMLWIMVLRMISCVGLLIRMIDVFDFLLEFTMDDCSLWYLTSNYLMFSLLYSFTSWFDMWRWINGYLVYWIVL